MFPKFTSDEQPYNLRRPYSMRRGNGQFDIPQPAFDYMDGNLDLSIHHPSTAFSTCALCSVKSKFPRLTDLHTGNRFAPLARPEAVVHRDREFHASRPHRRSRNSRGTKEAKKRRDSRRNKRKFAVHLLNEQLSHNIGETLTQYNIYSAPPVSLTTPTLDVPTTSISQTTYGNESTNVAPSAPQLPPITFHGFSLPDFPPLVIPRNSSPQTPPSMPPGVPAWCPPISSLTRSGGTASELPKFYDLSCLKEPKCQDLQLWKGSPSSTPKKQSRFFPPRPTSPKPTVCLPRTGAKCDVLGAGVHDPLDQTWKCESVATKPDSITQAIERIIAAFEATRLESRKPSAANLWNILEQTRHEPDLQTKEHELSCEDKEPDAEDPPIPVFNGQLGPFELAGGDIDIPYVHNNSLTGYANETAALHSESNVLGDSAIYLTEAFSSSNHLTTGSEQYGMPQPQQHHTSTPAFVENCYSDTIWSTKQVEIVSVPKISGDPAVEETEDSVAHFKSEQALFAASEPMEQSSQSASASFCDLATFLSMGHAEKCWCLACEEEPELVSEDTTMEPEESFTEDDGWMVWSTTGCENESANIVETDMTVNDTQVEPEMVAAPQQGIRADSWDEFFPRKPRRARALIKSETDAQFLGYYDDRAAFAHANEDEWEWNF